MSVDERRLEVAIRKAMVEQSLTLRKKQNEIALRYSRRANWYVDGYYDKTFARAYARIIAPRVAELLAADAAEQS